MDAGLADLVRAVAYLCLGGLFVVAGCRHFFLLQPLTEKMTALGVPFPRPVLIAGSIFQVAAGALLMTGQCVVPAALGLIVFTIVATLIFLRFWTVPTGPVREGVLNSFLQNIAVTGGLLLAIATNL